MSLIRLAHRQGILTGDLNDVQQLALIALMVDEVKERDQAEDAEFRRSIIAYHLGDAKKILDAIDQAKNADFAPELSEEEMEDYMPLSTQEVDAALDQLKRFGLAVQ